MEKISIRLTKALYKRNMKPIELSEKTGISKASISQYCSGYAEPKQDRIDAMSKALNINPAWLCGFDVPMEATPQIVAAYHHDNPKKNELIKIIQQTNIPDTNIDLLIQMIESWNFPKNDI